MLERQEEGGVAFFLARGDDLQSSCQQQLSRGDEVTHIMWPGAQDTAHMNITFQHTS